MGGQCKVDWVSAETLSGVKSDTHMPFTVVRFSTRGGPGLGSATDV